MQKLLPYILDKKAPCYRHTVDWKLAEEYAAGRACRP